MLLSERQCRLAMCEKQIGTVELCLAAGVNVSTLWRIWRGAQARPRTVGRIAAALGVPPASLLADEEEVVK